MAGAGKPNKRVGFVVVRQDKGRPKVRITSRDPQYNREQAVKDIAEIDALITEGKFKRFKTAKRPGGQRYLYRYVLADGRRFRQRTREPLKRD